MDVKLKPYNTKQLAALYGVSVPTIRNWIKKIPCLENRIGRIWNIKQIEIIFNHLGTP